MSKKSTLPKSFRVFPPLLTALLILLCVYLGSHMSLSELISYSPSNPILAASSIIFLFAIKSLSVVFPLSALYIVSAFWFGPLWAILINYIGLVVSISIPYLLGRRFASPAIELLLKKYPKLEHFQQLGFSNQLMLSYLLRIVSVLPGDLCSLFLGACSIEYKRYIIGSLLGLSPIMILHVLFADLFAESFFGGFWSTLTPKTIITIIGLIAVSIFSSIFLNKKYSIKSKK